MSKQGEISIALILSIVITVVAITLVLSFLADKEGFAKKIYCKSLYRVRSLYGYSDSYCENLNVISISKTVKEDGQLTEFSNGTKAQRFLFSPTNTSDQASISLAQDSNVSQASLNLIAAKKIRITFDDGSMRKAILFPLNGGIKEVSFELPRNSIIQNARIDVSGEKIPGNVDQIYVIDTSGSMENEWDTLCANLDILNQMLAELDVNSTTRVFGIGDGTTHGTCMERAITKEELQQQVTANGLQFQETSYFDCFKGKWPKCLAKSAPYDEYQEAWAMALLWVINNIDDWRENSKKIVYPVSDSDPTGGGPINYDYELNPPLKGDSKLSGTEQPAIDAVINTAGDVHIYPIYGDKGTTSGFDERFNVGVPEDQCRTTYADTCGKILSMMEMVAQDGKVTAYKNLSSIQNTILQAILLPYPRDITLTTGSFSWNFPGEMNENNSPQAVSGQALIDSIQDQLGSCNTEICRISIQIYNPSESAVIVENLRIRYFYDMGDTKVTVGDMAIPVTPITLADQVKAINITKGIRDALKTCHDPICDIPIKLQSSQSGEMVMTDLKVDYKRYFIQEELLRYITDCWTKNAYGKSKTSQACEEYVVPDGFRFLNPITEESTTALMAERDICHILANSEFGCGKKDNLEFTKDINTYGNVLIEYNGDKKQVIVS